MVDENKTLKVTCEQQEEKIRQLEKSHQGRINSLEQQTRKNNIIITGVPLLKDERIEAVIKDCIRAIGINLTEDDTDACHRLPPKKSDQPPAIIVKLVRRGLKHQIIRKWEKKKPILSQIGVTSRNRMYVSEHLSPRNADLFYKARCIQKEREIKYLRTTDGKILARTQDGEHVIKIRSEEDLRTLEN